MLGYFNLVHYFFRFTFAGVAVVIMGNFGFEDSFVFSFWDILTNINLCNANGYSLFLFVFGYMGGRRAQHFFRFFDFIIWTCILERLIGAGTVILNSFNFT